MAGYPEVIPPEGVGNRFRGIAQTTICQSQALQIISAMLALPGLQVLPTPAREVVGGMALLQRHPSVEEETTATRRGLVISE